MPGLADTPAAPYYAVIFTAERSDADAQGYAQTAAEMMALAADQPGYLGVETVHDEATGIGITVSYWTDRAAIAAWKADADHRTAQRLGHGRWYRAYRLRIARVEEARAWRRSN